MQSYDMKARLSRNSRLTVTLVGCATYTFLYCAAFRFSNGAAVYLLIASIVLLAYCMLSDERSWARVTLLASMIFNSGLIALGIWPVTLENVMIGAAAAVVASLIIPVRVQAACSAILLLLVAMALFSEDLSRERMCECWPGILLISVGIVFAIGRVWRGTKRRSSIRNEAREQTE